MRVFRRWAALALAGAIAVGIAAGCGGSDSEGGEAATVTERTEAATTAPESRQPTATRADFERYTSALLPTVDAAIEASQAGDPAGTRRAAKQLATGLRSYANQLEDDWPAGTDGAVARLRSEVLAAALSADRVAEDPNQSALDDFALSARLFAEEIEKARASFPSATATAPTPPASGTETERPFPMEEPHIENYELGYSICGPELGSPEENRREFGLPPGASLTDIAEAYADSYQDEFKNAAWQGCFDALSGQPSRI